MIALMAAAMVAANPPPLREPPGGVPQLMPVYGVSTDSRGVTVQLQPAGCNTLKSDFTVAISKAVDRPTILFARRSATPDLLACKARPRTVTITWSYDDLGLRAGQPFSLANPLVMAP
jgi:hypothetical protein